MANQFPYCQGNFNEGWKPHPSIGQGQSGQAGQTGQFNKQQQQPTLWQHISILNERSIRMEETLQQFIQATESTQKRTEAAITNLEIQMGQINKLLEERPDKNFGANTEVNPREVCKVLVSVNVEKVELEKEDRKEREEKEEEKICVKKKKAREKKKRTREKKKESYEKPRPHPKKYHRKKEFERFMEIFKKLEIKVPMIETLQQVPGLIKFLKKFSRKKKKKKEHELYWVKLMTLKERLLGGNPVI
ncbi:hypothetical protein VIGAN_04166100 [Vigna angularis var. angularis]|uniref:Uncharacterized protein n=1 Tax=Vigna angularis var. angularis TaxID=157739 RepID=A0A0S3RUN9_PHAAN|nr:hypothetical protein VIGAN_04166100 [Vigna angularis var. angularis]